MTAEVVKFPKRTKRRKRDVPREPAMVIILPMIRIPPMPDGEEPPRAKKRKRRAF